ncbi:MAG: hypothetical protein U9R50_05350 [Campylobacterota bacterium]|nr:hypothetical protein [Campylobacterota bacterium]
MKQFLELFSPQPANSYLLVTTHMDEVAVALADKLSAFDGSLHVSLYPGEHQEIKRDNIKLQEVKDFKTPFRALPRSFDAVIFQDLYHLHQHKERIIKLAYHALANTADIVIMQEVGTMDVQSMLEMLESSEYRAGNKIDVSPKYDLVMAKKMHMWGHGL